MRHGIRLILVALVVMCGASAGHAIPQLINYQGVLTGGSGTTVTVATTVTFALWNDPSAGDSLWSETQVITPDGNGSFNVLLGSVSAIPDSAWARYWGPNLRVRDVLTAPDDGLYLAGEGLPPGSIWSDWGIMKYTPSRDSSWFRWLYNGIWPVGMQIPRALAMSPDGGLLACGLTNAGTGGSVNVGVMKYLPSSSCSLSVPMRCRSGFCSRCGRLKCGNQYTFLQCT